MRYNFDDFKKVYITSNKNYYIKRHAYYNSLADAQKDAHRIYQRMKYTIQKNSKYKDISFAIGASNTKGDTAIKAKIKTKGRPKYKVYGKKVKPHIHMACYGKNAPTFVKEITSKLNKNVYKSFKEYSARNHKSNRLFTYDKFKDNCNGAYYVPYIFKQSNYFYSYGKMNFNDMKDDFFVSLNSDAINSQNFL